MVAFLQAPFLSLGEGLGAHENLGPRVSVAGGVTFLVANLSVPLANLPSNKSCGLRAVSLQVAAGGGRSRSW